jgi:hypothetical protein
LLDLGDESVEITSGNLLLAEKGCGSAFVYFSEYDT